jgi:hypothetical protein
MLGADERGADVLGAEDRLGVEIELDLGALVEELPLLGVEGGLKDDDEEEALFRDGEYEGDGMDVRGTSGMRRELSAGGWLLKVERGIDWTRVGEVGRFPLLLCDGIFGLGLELSKVERDGIVSRFLGGEMFKFSD